MPKRTRSHRLEDRSIQRVEQCLPDRWVVRRKDKDYGVDLEVEIFDEGDEATGLILYVQVKATDDAAKAGTLSIKTDRLAYLSSLDSPSIIVRYHSGTDSFRWMWLTNVQVQVGEVSSATATIRFDEETTWQADDPEKMVRTLQVYRTIRIAPRALPIGLTIAATAAVGASDYNLRCAVADVLDGSRAVVSSADPIACLPISVSLDGDMLRLEIDVITSVGVRLRSLDRMEIIAQLTYVLAYMASGYEFMPQARDLAEFIRDRELQCQSREISAIVAARLTDHPDLAADIAGLNMLHARQDESYAIYVRALLSSALPLEARLEAITRFYEAGLAEHADDPVGQSAIHYSYGNSLRLAEDFFGALRQYNEARRKNPSYCERAYFLCEVAASCYFAGRYEMAGRLYALAYGLEPRAQTAICAGDARLYAGRFAEAMGHYEDVLSSPDEFERADGALKTWLTIWASEIGDEPGLGIDRARLGDRTFWTDVLDDAMAAENPVDVVGACLMLCHLGRGDSAPLWAQAIATAPFTNDARLLELILTCAVWVHGHAAYSLFRDRAVDVGLSAKVFAGMDQLAAELNERRRMLGRDGVTARLVGEHHWDTVTAVDPIGGWAG